MLEGLVWDLGQSGKECVDWDCLYAGLIRAEVNEGNDEADEEVWQVEGGGGAAGTLAAAGEKVGRTDCNSL